VTLISPKRYCAKRKKQARPTRLFDPAAAEHRKIWFLLATFFPLVMIASSVVG
jgi:hypothetical protein